MGLGRSMQVSSGLTRCCWVLASQRVSAGVAGSRWVLVGLAGSGKVVIGSLGLFGYWHLKRTQGVEMGLRGSGQYLAGLDFIISRGLSWSWQVLVSLNRSVRVLVGLAGLSGSRHLKGSQQVLAGLGGSWRVLVGQDLSRLV